MNTYKALNNQVFNSGEYSLVPIRMEDRYPIMKWRNEQLYHLRQKEPLTSEQQDWYFNNVVAFLFDQEKPEQILFSFLKNGECIGYGGLVHIDWDSKNGEISFLLNTLLNTEENYLILFPIFLKLVEKAAEDCGLIRIYTYGYDIAGFRFAPLVEVGFQIEAILKNHVMVNDEYCNVRIYGKLLKNI